MIAHVSVPSRTPEPTARFFAAVIGGDVFDFPVVPGGMIAVATDGSGLAVEVYPMEMAHHPGVGDADPTVQANGPAAQPWEDQIHPTAHYGRPSGFHVAIGTNRTADEVMALARALGWRSLVCDRAGVFKVVEVWVDSYFLVEVLISAEVARYRAFMNPAGCTEMFGPSRPH